MIRVSVFYPESEGANHHDYYRDKHVPLCVKTWNLDGAEIEKGISGPYVAAVHFRFDSLSDARLPWVVSARRTSPPTWQTTPPSLQCSRPARSCDHDRAFWGDRCSCPNGTPARRCGHRGGMSRRRRRCVSRSPRSQGRILLRICE